MIGGSGVGIYFAAHPIDLRKSFDTLAAVVRVGDDFEPATLQRLLATLQAVGAC